MSIYATSGDNQIQVASNTGWGQFGEWADGLDIEKYPAIVTLWEHGIYEPADRLKAELRTAKTNEKPIADVVGIIDMLLGFDAADDYVLIGDGTEPAAETKSADTLEMPERLPDPHGMAFTDEELDALTDTDNEESVKLAMGKATPEKRALLGAKPVKQKE